jgi:hypothetical protein
MTCCKAHSVQRLRIFQIAADAVEAGGRGFLEGVLPNADDFPSLPAELKVHAFVAGYVVLALFVPEFPVSFRTGVALGADMPIASAVRRQKVRDCYIQDIGLTPFAFRDRRLAAMV